LETLPFGPLTDRTVHLCIDMQNLFALDTPWHTPWMARVLPVVARIAERHPDQTVFTRSIPPERPDQMPGSWRRYYERWRDLTQERMDPGLIQLVPPLRALAPPAEVIDKRGLFTFFRAGFASPAAPTGNREPRHHRCRNRCLHSGRSARRGRLRLPRCSGD
jgi:Isochorismatase family